MLLEEDSDGRQEVCYGSLQCVCLVRVSICFSFRPRPIIQLVSVCGVLCAITAHKVGHRTWGKYGCRQTFNARAGIPSHTRTL